MAQGLLVWLVESSNEISDLEWHVLSLSDGLLYQLQRAFWVSFRWNSDGNEHRHFSNAYLRVAEGWCEISDSSIFSCSLYLDDMVHSQSRLHLQKEDIAQWGFLFLDCLQHVLVCRCRDLPNHLYLLYDPTSYPSALQVGWARQSTSPWHILDHERTFLRIQSHGVPRLSHRCLLLNEPNHFIQKAVNVNWRLSEYLTVRGGYIPSIHGHVVLPDGRPYILEYGTLRQSRLAIQRFPHLVYLHCLQPDLLRLKSKAVRCQRSIMVHLQPASVLLYVCLLVYRHVGICPGSRVLVHSEESSRACLQQRWKLWDSRGYLLKQEMVTIGLVLARVGTS